MPKTLRLNIPVLLPHAPDAQDGCVGRLIALMQADLARHLRHIWHPVAPHIRHRAQHVRHGKGSA